MTREMFIFYASYLALIDGSIIRWSLTNYQEVFSLSMHHCYSSSCWDTSWWSGVIDSTFTYNGCKTVLHMRNTQVKLDEPSMYRHGLGTLETERSNVNHRVDMINIEMFTIDDYSIPRDDQTWFSWFRSRIIVWLEGCLSKWEFLSNLINWT